jgi:hypothetical protein
MSNTVIQIKFSEVTSAPPALNVGELAYSFTSDKLFVGNTTNGVLTIGGKYLTEVVDSATSSNTSSTLVKRDENGGFSATYVYASLFGNANTSSKLENGRDIGLSGDATGNVTFDGSQNVTLTTTLVNTGVSAATYGGATQIPSFAVDSKGRITSAANVAISTSLSVAADTGANTVDLINDTLTFVGGDGITTSIDPSDNVKIDVDNTVIRTTGGQTVSGDFTITGNLSVTGNVVYHGADDLVIDDPIIVLANNNTGNVLDIGFVGRYVESETQKEKGLVHHAATDAWYLFDSYEGQVEATNILNIADPTIATSNLVANLLGGTIYNGTINSLATALEVKDGGTGATSFTAGEIVVGDGTNSLKSLANTGTAGTYANASHVPVITTDAYGRVSNVVNTAIAIDTSQVTSGILPIARGGTNNTSYTTGALLQFNGTSIATLANSSYTQTGTLSTSNTVTSLTVDNYGRVTAATSEKIAIDASQITSGTLEVARGGTGASTFTTNGVLLGQGTGAISTASSSTEGHILTINSSGVPQFQMLSGGTF